MQISVNEAKKCQSEKSSEKITPKVAAIAVKNGEILAKAYRGEGNPGAHAEYILLNKLGNIDYSEITIYTTLEPCTKRNHPKIPCANRLVEKNINKIIVGMLDPNPEILGKGYYEFRQKNIPFELFENDYMHELENLNIEFLNQFKVTTPIYSPFYYQSNNDVIFDLNNIIGASWSNNDLSTVKIHTLQIPLMNQKLNGIRSINGEFISQKKNIPLILNQNGNLVSPDSLENWPPTAKLYIHIPFSEDPAANGINFNDLLELAPFDINLNIDESFFSINFSKERTAEIIQRFISNHNYSEKGIPEISWR